MAQDEDALISKSIQKSNSSHMMSRLKSRASGVSGGSVHALVAALEHETQSALNDLEDKLKTYQDNVKEFLNMREQTMGTISLVFEANESNSSMINEAILTYYLSKSFQLPKDKFRILSKIEFVQTADELAAQQVDSVVKKPPVPVVMVKIVFEIIQDQADIAKDLLRVKTEIKDGSSLLYDLTPSYMGINFGHSGLMTKCKLTETHLLLK